MRLLINTGISEEGVDPDSLKNIEGTPWPVEGG